jgi:6,7-dimethyl-8-ribityllumazine synthase
VNILIVEARYHASIADTLADGATAALEKGGAVFERIAVPGVLEIPPAIALAAKVGAGKSFDGYVALGCVLAAEIHHFGLIAAESARGLMMLGVDHGLCIGNGVLVADTEKQAFALADVGHGDAGGDAARACLALVALRTRLGVQR